MENEEREIDFQSSLEPVVIIDDDSVSRIVPFSARYDLPSFVTILD